MLFTDHFFLFYFFPIFFLIYLLVHKNITLANLVIIIFSIIFYSSFGIQNIPILLIPLILDYLLGIAIYKNKNKVQKKILLFSGIILNLLFLGFFKYLGFLLANIGLLIPTHYLAQINTFEQNLLIPVGISFITFQRISYIVDIYRKKTTPAYNFLAYSTYATVFPHLIAGPIVRYSNIKKQLTKRVLTIQKIFDGMKYLIAGLVLKILIADQLYKVESLIIPNIRTTHALESIMLLFYFSFRIYTDFAGYSLMAIGLAKFMGFDFPQNFDSPYRSSNITTFWRRWNMTLSSWLKDYLYIPLGGNKKGKIRTYINLLITMLLGGLWHGANWNFIIWGGFHGAYLAGERWLRDRNISIHLPIQIKILLTFLLISITWLTFIFVNPSEIIIVLAHILALDFSPISPKLMVATLWSIPSLVAAIAWSFFLSENFIEKIKPNFITILLLSILLLLSIGISLLNISVPFIYFQF